MTGVLPVMPVVPFAGVSKDPNGAAVAPGALMSTHTSMYCGELSIPVPLIWIVERRRPVAGRMPPGLARLTVIVAVPEARPGLTTIHG